MKSLERRCFELHFEGLTQSRVTSSGEKKGKFLGNNTNHRRQQNVRKTDIKLMWNENLKFILPIVGYEQIQKPTICCGA